MTTATPKLLANFLNAPNLVISSEEHDFKPFQLSGIKAPLSQNFVFPYNLIIGKQAEFCFAHYLEHSLRYKLISSNIQVNGKAQTIGEIDYLVFDSKTETTLHVELACKFYLYDSNLNTNKTSCWVGPNKKDTLKKKLDKFKLKQFPLIKLPETLRILKELQIKGSTIEQQLCLKAFLFIRKDSQPNRFANNFKNCIVGYWIPFLDFTAEDPSAFYAIPKKKEWLLTLDTPREWFGLDKTKNILKFSMENKQTVLVYKKTASQTLRFFVVWW